VQELRPGELLEPELKLEPQLELKFEQKLGAPRNRGRLAW
jgi:hypothetical protein